jgi:hypothetical protein
MGSVNGVWTDKHQKAVESFAARVLERKFREIDEEAKGEIRSGQAVADH